MSTQKKQLSHVDGRAHRRKDQELLLLRSLEPLPVPHYLQPGDQPFPGDLRGHSVSLSSELVDWASIPAKQMILNETYSQPSQFIL